MSLVVVALLTPRPGRAEAVLEAFREVSPLVHEEAGCELYAAHTDGAIVMMIERWTTRADLDAHAVGAPLAALRSVITDLLEKPYEVWILDNVPLGDPAKGTIPETIAN